MLKIDNLNIKFDKKIILKDSSFICCDGEITCITGMSGSGKTSILKYIIGQIEDDSSCLYYNNKEINHENRNDFLFNVVSYVDQFADFFPNMNIYQHFQFYSQLHNRKMNEDIVKDWLDKVLLSNIDLKISPKKLSTGERKRFLISLALMMKKEIIILDEPTASLDNENISIFIKLIQSLKKEGISFIITTHNDRIKEISDSIYKIDNYQLKNIKKDYTIKQRSTFNFERPKKLNYSQYKNFKQKFFFILMIISCSLSSSYIASLISRNISIQTIQQQNIQQYKNNMLYFMKSTDERMTLDDYSDLLSDDKLNCYDFISLQDIEKIKSIEGVKDVKPSYSIEKYSQSDPIYIYQKGVLKKEANVGLCTDGNCFNRNIIITPYYPEENLKNADKSLEGIYIDDILAQILDIPSYENIKIAFKAYVEDDFCYKNNPNDGMRELYSQSSIKKEVKLSIKGVLKNNNDGRYATYGRIFMPFHQFKELLKTFYSNHQNLDALSKQYIIFCEDGFDENVKLKIENLDQRYYVENKQLTQKDMVNHLFMQNQSTLYMTISISCLILISALLLVVCYVKTLEKEIKLLKREGLQSLIKTFYHKDDIKIIMTSMLLSILFLLIRYGYEPSKLYFSKGLYVFVWIITTIIFIFIIVMIKKLLIQYEIKRNKI